MDESQTQELKPLTPGDLLFIVRYFEMHMNGTQAYLSLHPKSSYNNARSCAADILAKPNIKAEIRRRIDEQMMSADEAELGIADIARGDIGDLLDNNGLLDIRTAREKGLTKLLRKIKQKTITRIGKKEDDDDVEITEIEFEMYDAHAAKRDILKLRGRFSEHVELTGANGSPLIPPVEKTDNELRDSLAEYIQLASIVLASAGRTVVPQSAGTAAQDDTSGEGQ